jgi:hypothetical protein
MMDELNELKHAWKTIAESRNVSEYSLDEIKKIVKGRSNNELLKIRRKIIIEWSLTLLLSLFLVLFIFFFNPNDTNAALLLVSLILAISFVPYIKVIRLKFSSHPYLKTYLTEFIHRFDRLIKQYMQMAAILMPIAGVGGFLLGIHSTATDADWQSMFNFLNLTIAFLIVLLVSFLGYWVQRRYFIWIYGKNIQRLRDCLNDLEEAEHHEE